MMIEIKDFEYMKLIFDINNSILNILNNIF